MNEYEHDADLVKVIEVDGEEPEARTLDETESDPEGLGDGEDFAEDMPKDEMPESSWTADPDDTDGQAGLTGKMEE